MLQHDLTYGKPQLTRSRDRSRHSVVVDVNRDLRSEANAQIPEPSHFDRYFSDTAQIQLSQSPAMRIWQGRKHIRRPCFERYRRSPASITEPCLPPDRTQCGTLGSHVCGRYHSWSSSRLFAAPGPKLTCRCHGAETRPFYQHLCSSESVFVAEASEEFAGQFPSQVRIRRVDQPGQIWTGRFGEDRLAMAKFLETELAVISPDPRRSNSTKRQPSSGEVKEQMIHHHAAGGHGT